MSANFQAAHTLVLLRSYWTWLILTALIFSTQGLGVLEKVWVRVSLNSIVGDTASGTKQYHDVQEWGQAYGNSTTVAPYTFTSSALMENEALMSGFIPSHDISYYSNPFYHVQATQKFLWFDLPDANEEPLFYVGIYGAIGLTSAIIGILSTAVQYTGALRASRLVFKQLLVGVVRATMRWHDVTPQGTG